MRVAMVDHAYEMAQHTDGEVRAFDGGVWLDERAAREYLQHGQAGATLHETNQELDRIDAELAAEITHVMDLGHLLANVRDVLDQVHGDCGGENERVARELKRVNFTLTELRKAYPGFNP